MQNPGLAALLRSAGFFSEVVFFAQMTLARSASDRIQKVQTSVNLIDLVKSILTSNYHLLANIGLDIAENEPSEASNI